MLISLPVKPVQIPVAYWNTALKTRQKVRRVLLLSFLFLFPISFNFYSPYLPIAGTLERVAAFSLLFWLAWTLAALVLGGSACGYICPLGGLQAVWDWAAGCRLVRLRQLSILKYTIFALWIGGIISAAISSGGWQRVDLLYRTESGISWDSPDRAVIYAGMLGLVLLICLPRGRRAFCHYLCWWAPPNTLASKLANAARLPALRLKAEPERRRSRRLRTRNCPLSQPVTEMVQAGRMASTECILCGTCVDNCERAAISYGWRPPRSPKAHPG